MAISLYFLAFQTQDIPKNIQISENAVGNRLLVFQQFQKFENLVTFL